MNVRNQLFLVAACVAAVISTAFFPMAATWISDTVPMAHLIFAPLGNVLISTITFAVTLAWFLLTRFTPWVRGGTVRFVARVAAIMVGLIWSLYAGFWVLIYWLDGI